MDLPGRAHPSAPTKEETVSENMNTAPAEAKDLGYTEKLLKPMSGYLMLAVNLLVIAGSIVMIATGSVFDITPVFVIGFLLIPVWLFLLYGYCVVAPNEAVVLTLFGKYKGTIKQEGYYWYSPFCRKFNPAAPPVGARRKHVSMKAMTLNNEKQKVNDADGNPIEIGVVVIWRIRDAAKAVFNVDNYANFIAIQSDAAIRNIARQYPYDVTDDDEKSLRGSAQEIAATLCLDLQQRVEIAGIEVVEARIAHLAYAQEIAAAMLQRQQAKAIVDARTTIVEGAVGMVELALAKLGETGLVSLDDDRKAQMVSNLMVVLCANKDTQPIVNSGTV